MEIRLDFPSRCSTLMYCGNDIFSKLRGGHLVVLSRCNSQSRRRWKDHWRSNSGSSNTGVVQLHLHSFPFTLSIFLSSIGWSWSFFAAVWKLTVRFITLFLRIAICAFKSLLHVRISSIQRLTTIRQCPLACIFLCPFILYGIRMRQRDEQDGLCSLWCSRSFWQRKGTADLLSFLIYYTKLFIERV